MLVLGVDMGNAPAVAQNVYRLFEASHLERAVEHGERGLRPALQTILIDVVPGAARGRLSGPRGNRAVRNKKAENTDAPLHTGDILSQRDERARRTRLAWCAFVSWWLMHLESPAVKP